MSNVHFSSASDDWETPHTFFAELAKEFRFVLDVAASHENAKCDSFFTINEDGLNNKWASNGDVWMNPPYGRGIKHWIKKAYETSLEGTTVVCLVPSRTDTSWWHDYVMKGEVRFVRGRLKFGGHKNSAPFPSAVVIFRGAK